MIGIHIALAQGCPIRHRDWPPFHYAKLARVRDGKPKLYRCYPDGHLEILDIDLSDLCREDGWLILGSPPDQPPSAA
ncbi:MAG: hypothetical protein ACR2RA_21140 [Geminicoccaceae bacterium]